MDWGVDIPSGSWEVKIEYSHKRENGDSRLEFWWQGPESYLPPLDANCAASPYEWCAGYRVAWNSPTDSYILRRLEGSGYLDHDWGNSGPGYGIYADFSAEWSRLARFDAGLYRFHTTHDDGVKINVAGQEILNQWGTCCQRGHRGRLVTLRRSPNHRELVRQRRRRQYQGLVGEDHPVLHTESHHDTERCRVSRRQSHPQLSR